MSDVTTTLKGSIAATGVALNTVICGTVLMIPALIRIVTPDAVARGARKACTEVAQCWISVNSWIVDRYRGMRWTIDIPDSVNMRDSYVINCNHQSWVDIVVLQKVFNRRAPFMRFFIKQQLIWVPVLGLCWWGLDFPFMRRYSRDQIAANPSLRARDLESARKACEKFTDIPVSMMNFLEGTRFSESKKRRQKSPYRHLLKPKVGGLGQVFFSLSDQLTSLIDVTIVYPDGAPTLWDLLCGKVQSIIVVAREVAIPQDLLGRNIQTDPAYIKDLKTWTAELWAGKDERIDKLLATHDADGRG